MINEDSEKKNLEDIIIILPEQDYLDFLEAHFECAMEYVQKHDLKGLDKEVNLLMQYYNDNKEYLQNLNHKLDREYIIKLGELCYARHVVEKEITFLEEK